MKKRIIFISIFIIDLLANICSVILFKDKIALKGHSVYMIAIAALMAVKGVLAYVLKHKGNTLGFHRTYLTVFSPDLDYTYTEEYEKQFSWMMFVYWLAIPFYIPSICFASKWPHFLWFMAVIIVPQLVFIVAGIRGTVKEVKNQKLKQQERERELREQERREEMGHYR